MWTAPGFWPFETFAPDEEFAADTEYRISTAGDWTNLPIDDWQENTFRTGSARAAPPGTVEIAQTPWLDIYDLAVAVPEASVLRVHADACDDPAAGVLNAWGVSDGDVVRFTAPAGACVCAVVANLAGVDGEPTTHCP
jgi:hypothetical protein